MSGNALRRLAEDVGGFATDPLGHALYSYPWGEPGPLQDFKGPRRWQLEALAEIRDHLSNPETRFTPLRMAITTGHGTGKTAFIAMVVCAMLDTCVDTRIIVTANTESQLATKVSAELAKWRGLALTKAWFRTEAMSHRSVQAGHAQSWRCDLIPWNIHQPEAFAGLHNMGKRIIVIMDEASAIPDSIWTVIEGALTDENTEIILIAVGNPTRNSGRFHACFHGQRHLWSCRQLDSRAVEGTNKQYLDEIVATYGEDSDIARVRVRGQFPSQSSMTFIRSDAVDAARVRVIPKTDYLPSDPVIFGLDHARFGGDETVLAIRQGRDARARPWLTRSGANSMEIAGAVNEAMRRYLPDAVFIDAGGPNAGGIIDRLRQLNPDCENIFEINFGSSWKDMEAVDYAGQRTRVKNKRSQMWTNMRSWLDRGAIPDHQRLTDDLTCVEYSYDLNNAILLEKKEHLRARGYASPDYGDALALTFAENVAKREPDYLNSWKHQPEKPFDRYAELANDFDDQVRRAFDQYGTAMPSALWPARDRYDD